MDRPATPLSIKVICAIWILFALLNLVQLGQVLTSISLSADLLMPITLIITLSIAYVAVGVGLWKTRSWAWKGALAFVVVGIVTSLVQGVLGLPIAVLLLLVGIYLVLRREVFTDKPVPPSPQQ